jgi:hypothetical protein
MQLVKSSNNEEKGDMTFAFLERSVFLYDLHIILYIHTNTHTHIYQSYGEIINHIPS